MDKQQKYNTIFFDAGGVLFDTKISRSERIKNILVARGFNEQVIDNAIKTGNKFSEDALKTGPWLENWEKEEIYWDNYYGKILDSLGEKYTYSLKRQLFHQTHYAIHCTLFEEVREVLENLHGKYRLGVISNAFPSMDWVFDYLDIRKYFESITISSFVGVSKPEKRIYEAALNSLGAKAEECLFIDNKLKNVEAAIEIGFSGLYLDRKMEDLSVLLKKIGIGDGIK
jgi:putative hydrolase of the HAD superfamily